MKSLYKFLIFGVFNLIVTLQLVNSRHAHKHKMADCEEMKRHEIEILVKHVERTVDECEFVTLTKGELFRCFFKRINMTKFGEEGKSSTGDKIKDIRACAEKYTTEKPRDVAHLETGLGFVKCFYDATKKFEAAIHDECHPMEMTTMMMSS